MGEQAVIYVNTALLIFIVGLLIGFGRWLVVKIHEIDNTVSKNCLEIVNLKATASENSHSIGNLRLDLAVHAATPHCGEEGK